jgi:hypothetical protein
MENHFTLTPAKRRRLERTQGTLIDPESTRNPSDAFLIGTEPNYATQIPSYAANPIPRPESIRSNALSAEAPLETQTRIATQQSLITGLGSDLSFANNISNESCGLVQALSGANANEFICFGMVITFKPS